MKKKIIANQGLNFLNSRKEFWKQQKKLNQNLLERKLKDNSFLLHNQLMHILKKLKEIDKCKSVKIILKF